MFCVKCGRENREDASFCVRCGANMVQIPKARVIERPSSTKRPLWIVGIVATVALIFTLAVVISIAVHVLAPQPAHVVVDGKTAVGADGEPIELFQNSTANNVTWAQLKQFLSSDQTDGIPYNDITFVCADYAETLHNNAEKAGIRAGYVHIDFASGTPSHAINVFNTTDRGLIYVDDTGTTDPSPCSADKTVDVEVGRSYIPESIFPCPGYSDTWGNMGTVTDFSVIW